MENYGFGSDKSVNLLKARPIDFESQKQEFVSDKFDDIKPLKGKEINLLVRGAISVLHTKTINWKGFAIFFISPATNQHRSFLIHTFLTTLGLNKFRTSRRLLFERDSDKESLFEEILQTPDSSTFIKLIWSECELWRSSDVLTNANPKGMQPIDYVIKSGDDGNLLSFLVFDCDEESDSVTKANKKYFLKRKNEQHKVKTGRSLFQKFYSIHDQQSKQVCLIIMEKLLREMQRIDDIKAETAIDEALQISDEIYKHEILKLLVTYWSVDSHDYDHYRAVLSDSSPYYKLILMLKETDEGEFEELFEKYLAAMKQKHGDEVESIVQADCNSLLEFALGHGQRKVIDVIVNCGLVDANKVSIRSDLPSVESKDAQYLMARLLENGYYLGNDGITNDWITSQVLNDFLDSRVSLNGSLGCEVDYNFLINPNIRDEEMKSVADDNVKLLFSRGMQPLEIILNNERLRSSITHPVLATFINLKYFKFRRIFYTNFFIFVFFYVLPFFFFFMLLPFRRDYFKTLHADSFYLWDSHALYENYDVVGIVQVLRRFCYFSTTCLTFREIFQLFMVNDNWREYFSRKSNLLEILIILLSWSQIYLFDLNYLGKNELEFVLQIAASIIILATVELLMILPYRSMTIYMIMMKQVTFTFVRFFTIFILVIIAFSLCFFVVLKPSPYESSVAPWDELKTILEVHFNSTDKAGCLAELEEPALKFVDTMEDVLARNATVLNNFGSPVTSFMKTLQMLRGGVSVEPYIFNTLFEKLLFLLFVLTSFVLFNLINGLAIKDIAMLKGQAAFLNLEQQIRNVADSESFLSNMHWKTSVNSARDEGKLWWRRFIIYLMSLPIRKFPHLHKIENLSIDFKTKTVHYEHDQKKLDILQMRSGQSKKYFLDDETLKKFHEIVAKQQSHDEGVDEKVEALQTEVKLANEEMKKQMNELEANVNEKLEVLQLQMNACNLSIDEVKILLLQVLAEGGRH